MGYSYCTHFLNMMVGKTTKSSNMVELHVTLLFRNRSCFVVSYVAGISKYFTISYYSFYLPILIAHNSKKM